MASTVALLAETWDWLAADKPAGVVVIPARGEDPALSLRHQLERELGHPLWVVHRLDRGTSGVVLFARTAEAHRRLSMAFERGAVRKLYLALTEGLPPEQDGSIEVPLHAARRGKMRPARTGEPGALAARTDYAVLRRWTTPGPEVGLVEARPRTGRQHQVRVHLRAAGAPLLVDPLYGRRAVLRGEEVGAGPAVVCGRLTLHAAAVEFDDPLGGQPVLVESPLPRDLAGVVALLDAAAAHRGTRGP
ncbi:MAG: RNA pseudouridine synthase [Acidobacteria bacterium]|nr:RNA pseudouridine synthase [Acidobacteriota bacterium]